MSAKWVAALVLLGILAGLGLASSIQPSRTALGFQAATCPDLPVYLLVTATPHAPTDTPTSTSTPADTATPTGSPTGTDTPTASATPRADTDTPTATETATGTATASPSHTPTPPETDTPTPTPTETETAIPQSFPDWKGEYFDNPTLTGIPIVVRNDAAIDFNWGSGSPNPQVPVDHFSARWTRTLPIVVPGIYLFRGWSDDGERLFVDDVLRLEYWRDRSCAETDAAVFLAAGVHTLRYEYYEYIGPACAKLTWEWQPPTPTPTATIEGTVTPTASATTTATPRPTITSTPSPTETPTAEPGTETPAPTAPYLSGTQIQGCIDSAGQPVPCPGRPVAFADSGLPTEPLAAQAAGNCERQVIDDFDARPGDLASWVEFTTTYTPTAYPTPEPYPTLPLTQTPVVNPTPTFTPPPGSGTVWQFAGVVNGQVHVARWECWSGWDWEGLPALPYLRLDWLN